MAGAMNDRGVDPDQKTRGTLDVRNELVEKRQGVDLVKIIALAHRARR